MKRDLPGICKFWQNTVCPLGTNLSLSPWEHFLTNPPVSSRRAFGPALGWTFCLIGLSHFECTHPLVDHVHILWWLWNMNLSPSTLRIYALKWKVLEHFSSNNNKVVLDLNSFSSLSCFCKCLKLLILISATKIPLQDILNNVSLCFLLPHHCNSTSM